MAYEEIVDMYLAKCADSCNGGGFTRLSASKRSIRDSVLDKFSGNGYERKKVSKILDISQTILDERMKSGRHFSWPSHLEKEIRSGISSALQEV